MHRMEGMTGEPVQQDPMKFESKKLTLDTEKFRFTFKVISLSFCKFISLETDINFPVFPGDLSEKDKRAVFLTVHDIGSNHSSFQDFIEQPCMCEVKARSIFIHVDLPGQSVSPIIVFTIIVWVLYRFWDETKFTRVTLVCLMLVIHEFLSIYSEQIERMQSPWMLFLITTKGLTQFRSMTKERTGCGNRMFLMRFCIILLNNLSCRPSLCILLCWRPK